MLVAGVLIAGVQAALHNNRDEVQLVEGGEDLVLSGWVLVADGRVSRDYLTGPGVEQQQEQSGVEVQ